MDYIYSYLNDDVASREMHGSETNTAVVTVNAATNTISVDVKPISPSMLNVAKPTESGSYILQETISALGEVSYSWATLEDYNQEVTQAIADLTQQLEQEKQERIESVQTEANVRELADIQLRTEFTSELAQEKQEREQDINEEAQRTNSMINQLNDNVQSGFNIINDVLTTSINNINNAILNESTIREEQFDDTTFRIRDLNTRLGVEIDNRERRDAEIYANLSTDIANEKRERVEQDQDIRNSISIGLEEERQARADADETLQSNIDAEANERKSVDQHLWDILPDNIIAGTPMQGMENGNAINIVFSKYQKHGIGEDPADAELVEVPNQAITLFPATQEVAGVLTATDKTKIDNIATDIDTAVQAEANARKEADNALSERITAIEDTNVLQSQILGDGRIQTTINSPAGRTFDIDVVDISNASNDDRFTVTLNNNDSISAKLTDGTTSIPLVFMSKWDKVEVGGSGAPLNLNSDDGTVTVNDTYTLLDNRDEDELNDAIEDEKTRATQAEQELRQALATEEESRKSADDTLQSNIDTEVDNRKNAIDDLRDELKGDVTVEYNTLGKLEDKIQSAESNIVEEQERATSVETNIQTNSNYPFVVNSNVAIGITTDAGSGTISFAADAHNPTTNESGTVSVSEEIPVATATSAGFMTSAQVNELADIRANAIRKDADAEQIIQGSIAVNGNLTVRGNTITQSQESLTVKDNFIITNGDGITLSDLSGIFIKDGKTDGYAIAYDPIKDAVILGQGTIDSNNAVSVNSNERNAFVTRKDSGTFITDNLIKWNGSANIIEDAGIPYGQVARKDEEQTFAETQTFSKSPVFAENTISLGGIILASNVAGTIAVESQITDAVNSLVNGANDGYQNFGEVESTVSAINTDLQEYKTSTNQNIAQLENDLESDGNRITQAENNIIGINSNLSLMNSAIQSAQSSATNAYTYAGEANTLATTANTAITNHIANINNPHNVTKEQIGLSKVADVLQYSEENEPPYPVTSVAGRFGNITLTKSDVGLDNVPNVNTANASNINSGTLAINRIAGNLIIAGTNVEVSRDDESGVYTISAETGGNAPVTSVAGKTGDVELNSITFTGACEATYNGSSDITVTIPNVPALHSVSLSTNNGSASTVIGNVYSNSANPIEISIVRGTPTGKGVAVVDIQVTTEGNVVTITPVLGPVDDGTLL